MYIKTPGYISDDNITSECYKYVYDTEGFLKCYLTVEKDYYFCGSFQKHLSCRENP